MDCPKYGARSDTGNNLIIVKMACPACFANTEFEEQSDTCKAQLEATHSAMFSQLDGNPSAKEAFNDALDNLYDGAVAGLVAATGGAVTPTLTADPILAGNVEESTVTTDINAGTRCEPTARPGDDQESRV